VFGTVTYHIVSHGIKFHWETWRGGLGDWEVHLTLGDANDQGAVWELRSCLLRDALHL
jgi:hypothetical protein